MSIAAAFADLLPPFLMPGDRADIDDVLDAAAAWAAGALPLEAFARQGTIPVPGSGKPSPGFTRWCAVALAGDDPRRADLLRAVDALLAFRGLRATNHGVFSSEDLAGSGVTIRYERKEAA